MKECQERIFERLAKRGEEREHFTVWKTAHKEKRHSTGKDTVAVFRSVTFRFNFSAVLQKRDSTTFPHALRCSSSSSSGAHGSLIPLLLRYTKRTKRGRRDTKKGNQKKHSPRRKLLPFLERLVADAVFSLKYNTQSCLK